MGTVVPFVKPVRPPGKGEMAAWRMMTKGWSDEMKKLITPREWEASLRGQ